MITVKSGEGRGRVQEGGGKVGNGKESDPTDASADMSVGRHVGR